LLYFAFYRDRSVKYQHAPIVESVIDFRLHFANPPSNGALRKCASSFSNFSAPQELRSAHVTVYGGGQSERKAEVENKQAGYRLESKSMPRVLQVQPDGFSYSHLAPYTDWETFCAEAVELWREYVAALKPTTIKRYAVRTINKFTVPERSVDMEKYFNIYPRRPEGAAEAMTSFFLQMLLPQPEVGPDTLALLNMSPGESESFQSAAIFLDIDIFSAADVPANSPEIWDRLASIRKRKDDLFELCITDETRKLIS